MRLVSIIIPVYKVERYLNRCVDSVVNQTYRNLEIVLVDDGSPDNCPAMCDEWGKKDNRIKVIHKCNGGLSSARNAGLDICTGDYIMFLDSDDWYDLNTIEFCIDNIEVQHSDVAVFGIRGITDEKVINEEVFDETYTYGKMIERLFLYGDSVWNKIYKKYLWDGLRFKNGMQFEDRYAMADIYCKTSKVSVVLGIFYNYYRANNDSLMTKLRKLPRETFFRWECEQHAIDKLGNVVSINALNRAKTSAMEHALKAHIINLSMHCLSDDEYLRIREFITKKENTEVKLRFEYMLYAFSFKMLDLVNRIKSLEYLWKYR